ncbi:hypothetical protein ACSBR2_004923 [Camellia fascicularis]
MPCIMLFKGLWGSGGMAQISIQTLVALPNQQTVDYPSFKLVIVGDGGAEREVHFHDGALTIQADRNFLIQSYGGYKPSVDAIKGWFGMS